MSHGQIRFIHAADFHLELPPFGVTEVPDHLRELFIEAPFWAAERVFETVLAEKADFLVLSGDLLDPLATGPRGPLFLVEQFGRLCERGIPVYWAGGRVDPPESWLPSVPLPDNVHLFPGSGPEEVIHRRQGEPLVCLLGSSGASERAVAAEPFDPGDECDMFSVAVVYGEARAEDLQARAVDYWALGGRHRRQTLFHTPTLAHYPGTPQGRHPEETGQHGCTLVRVDSEGNARTARVPTEVIRWETERISIDETTSRQRLERTLHERMQALVQKVPGIDILVTWSISGDGPLVSQLRRGETARELLEMLRTRYGFGPPAAWSVSLEVEAGTVIPPDWYEQQSFRGDFLRELRRLQDNPGEPLNLEAYVSEECLAGPLAKAVALADRPSRDRVLREAAALGVALLSGEEAQP